MQLHQIYDQVVETGTKIIAISVDGQVNANETKVKTGVNFDILCDEKLEVVEKYNLKDDELRMWDYLDGKSVETTEAKTISLCANILVNKKGMIVSEWNGHYNFRPSTEETIALLKKM